MCVYVLTLFVSKQGAEGLEAKVVDLFTDAFLNETLCGDSEQQNPCAHTLYAVSHTHTHTQGR